MVGTELAALEMLVRRLALGDEVADGLRDGGGERFVEPNLNRRSAESVALVDLGDLGAAAALESERSVEVIV